MQLSKKLSLPKNPWIVLIIAFAVHKVIYFVTSYINVTRECTEATIFLDKYVPFFAPFIFFYILAYLQWVLSYIYVMKKDESVFRLFIKASIITDILAGIVFLAFPTTITQPEVVGDGIFERLTRLIYACDNPVNLLPSLHVSQSWICFRSFAKVKSVPKLYTVLNLILALLVFASTVLVKQHYLIDIPTGILITELGIFLASVLSKKSKDEKLLTSE